jgi:hypothetical protein
VDQAVPLIYSRDPRASFLSAGARLAALGIALSCLLPLIIAARLHPDAGGSATHTQLGLQPCAFLQRTGIPCPSCGMTTSWTWLAHGNLAASFYVQPMGTVLAMIAAACVWVGLYVAVTGRPVHRLLRLLPGRYYFVPLLSFALLAWAWKIFIHVHGLDGWH